MSTFQNIHFLADNSSAVEHVLRCDIHEKNKQIFIRIRRFKRLSFLVAMFSLALYSSVCIYLFPTNKYHD